MAGRDGGFLMLPFKAGADCAAPPLYILSNNREGKNYDYSS